MAIGSRSAPGDLVAGYRIERLVGSGGMGDVYRALDTRLDRPVALKLLASRLAEDDAFRERLVRESRLAASLDHPNVVPVYEAGEDGGRLFIAMRFVEGSDLKSVLRREGPLGPSRAMAIARQVADALDSAHERGLVHRDVKPSNVLLDQQGGREHVYLADFGLTQSTNDHGPTDGQLMGTVDYVAPEQIRGDDVDGRADVYALGCLLFETLTGTLPFGGASDVAVVYAHLEEPPPRATERNPALPSAVDAVLARAMAKDRDERPDSCRELVDELQSALGLEAEPRRRGGAVLAATAAAVVVAAAGVAGIALLTGDGTGSPEPAGGIVRIDAETGEPSALLRLGEPTAVAASRGIVWVTGTRDGALWRVTGSSGVARRVSPNGTPRDVTIRGDRVFVSSDGAIVFTGMVTQYDLVSGFPHGSVPILACTLTGGPLGVWAAGCPNVDELVVGSDALEEGRSVPIPFQADLTAADVRVCLCSMAQGLGSVWVTGDWSDPRLWRIDPRRARIAATFELPFKPHALAVADGSVWVADFTGDRVARLDPRTGAVRGFVPVGRGPVAIAAGADAVWVANGLDGTVSRIDPSRLDDTDTIDVGAKPVDIDVDGADVWVAVEGEAA